MTRQIPWLSVFVEGVVIVGSILLAFGLQAWWEGRQQSAHSDQTLNTMLADLSAETAWLDSVSLRFAADERSGIRLLANIDNSDFPFDSVEFYLQDFYSGGPYTPSLAGYTAALQSGVLPTLPDSLSASIVSYFGASQAFFSDQMEGVRGQNAGLTELLQPYFRPYVAAEVYSLYPFPPGVRRLDSTWNELRTDNALMTQVLEFGTYAGYIVGEAESRLKENVALQATIRSALGLDPG